MLNLFRYRLFLLFLTGAAGTLYAQTTPDLHRHDAAIKRLYEARRSDSFLLLTREKSLLARQADSLALWGWVQYRIQKFYSDTPAEALRRIDQSLKEQWRPSRNAEEAEPFLYLYTYQADHYLQRGLLVSAVSAGETAATLYERYRYADFDPVEGIYKALGNNYTRLGDNEKALAVFQKALRSGGDDETVSGLYNNIGTAYWNSGNYQSAESFFRKGLILKGISEPRRGLLLAGLAQVELDNGQPAAAYRTASGALQLLRNAAKPGSQQAEHLARAAVTAAEASMALQRYAESERLLSLAKKQSDLPPRDRAKIEIARARLALLRGQFPQAMYAANNALQTLLPRFRPQRVEDAPSDRDFYEENAIFEALTVKADAAEQYAAQHDPAHWLNLAADCHDLAWKAEMLLRKTFRYQSSKLKLQWTARLREEAAMRVVYKLYQIRQDKAAIFRGLVIAERSKDLLLREAIRENIALHQQESGDQRFEALRLQRRNLAYFEKRILTEPDSPELPEWQQMADQILTRVKEMESALQDQYPLVNDENGWAGERLKLHDIPADALLVEYFVSDSFVDLFVSSSHQVSAWHRLKNDTVLRELTTRFLAFFEQPNAIFSAPDAYYRVAYALWQKLVPLEAAAAGKLLIVPDGFLNFIPFEALLYEAAPFNTSLRQAPYLLKKQCILYTWSLSTLSRQAEIKTLKSNVLLGVAPGFSNGERGLAPLAAGEEWQGAGRFDLQELNGSQATVAQLQQYAADARILHFSTHAFAGETPRIELYDQSLLLPDVYTMPIGADLVVLSACQTGLGKEQKGEGVMSLARAFASSGAASVISSLWSVNDRSTARLFERFYTHLNEKMSTAAALRQAKLDYLSDATVGTTGQSPYFWAGLLMIGAEREIESGLSVSSLVWWGATVMVVVLFFILYWRRTGK